MNNILKSINRLLNINRCRFITYRYNIKHNQQFKRFHLPALTFVYYERQNYFTFKNAVGLTAAFGLALAFCEPKKPDEDKIFFKAAKYGDIDQIKLFLGKKKYDVNKRHNLGWTILMVAAVNGHVDLCKYLIDVGADLDLGDNYVNAHRTSTSRGLHSVEVFFIRDDEFCNKLNNRASFLGCTALHYAALTDQYDVIKLLLEAGANPCILNDAGHLPINYALEGPTLQLLKQYTEKQEEIEKQKELEERRRFPLEQRFKQYIVGQEAAIAVVASTIRRKENGWFDEDHPLVFLFLGSSGIGKTELAKQLASYIHKDKMSGFIRLDMSEYQEKHEVAKLIGAPPGYIGHDDGGQLTSRLKKNPKAVVLFDEVDKAHPDVLTVLLQLFDEGRLTDGKGKTIDCKDAVFIMTSNLASDEIAQHAIKLRQEIKLARKKQLEKGSTEDDFDDDESITISRQFKDNVVKPILKRHFKRDEFLGRINEIVYFLPFSRIELLSLVTRELEQWARRALDRHKIELTWDRTVESALADGYDVNYGARSIKYEVERRIINQLAGAYESGEIKKGSAVHILADWSEKNKGDLSIKLRVKYSGLKDFVDIKQTDTSVKRISLIF